MSVISNLVVKIGADSSGLQKGLTDTQKAIKGAFDVSPIQTFTSEVNNGSKSIESMIGKVKSLTAVAAAGFGLKNLVGGIVEAGDATYRLSQRMNISAGDAAKLNKIMKLTGGDATSASTALMRLDKSFSSASKEGEKTREVLSATGVALTDNEGKLLPVNDQLKNLADGYKRANQAGYGQEFIMNTLGVRGMALVATLEQYNEAAETASKVQSVGLDPKAMHELNMEIQALQMQASQIGTAMAMAFVPIAQEIMPDITSGLAELAAFLKENKSQIAGFTTEAAKLYAVYKAFSMANNVFSWLMTSYAQIAAAAQGSAAVQIEAQTAVTASQERQLNRLIAKSNSYYLKMQADAVKAFTAQGEASESARIKLAADLEKIQIQADATAAKIAATFKARYAQINAASQEMAAANTASYNAMSTAAVEANAKVATSTAVVTEATVAATTAHVAEGNAAVVAGEKNTASKTLATKATTAQVAATEVLAAAHTMEGNAAASAGTKAITFSALATKGVGKLKAAVMALTGGWLGLAAAIAYAGYCAYQFMQSERAKAKENTYYVDGQSYTKRNGQWWSNRYGENTRPITDERADKLNRLEKFNAESRQRSEEQAQKDEQAKINKDIEDMMSKFKAMSGEAADASDSLKELSQSTQTAAEKEIKTYQIEIPIGRDVVSKAAEHVGESWGNNTCAKFVSAVLSEAGVDGLNSVNGDVLMNQAGSAYHKASSGYIPKAGDIINWQNHVGIYDGNGGYIASNSKTGVRNGTMSEADSWFGPTLGYISMSDYTGGQTVTKTVDDTGKALAEQQEKLEQAKRDATRLMESMQSDILDATGTAYEKGYAQIADNIRNKELEINKLANQGVDVTELRKKLIEYGRVLDSEFQKKWNDTNKEAALSAKVTIAEIEGDYKALAEAQYNLDLQKLEREKENKEKELLMHKDSVEGKAALDEWYASESVKIEKKRADAIRKSYSQKASYLTEQGDVEGLQQWLSTQEAIQMQAQNGHKTMAETMLSEWKKAHISMEEISAKMWESASSNMASTLSSFIKGTKTAGEAFADFANSVLDAIAQMAAQMFASQLMSGIFGGASSALPTPIKGVSAGKTFPGGWAKGGSLPGYAQGGGLISGAGTGTSDSILAYLEQSGRFIRVSDGEFIMNAKATSKYAGLLEQMNCGKYAEGGYMSAPVIKGGRGYSSNSPYSSVGGAGGGVIVNIHNNTNDNVRVQNSTYDGQTKQFILDVVVEGASRNVNGFQTNMKSLLGGRG